MVQNPEMHEKARLESEPEFCNVLRRNGYVDVVQGTTDDDYKHKDVFAWRKGRCWTFDVKDLTDKWKGVSRKYRISSDMYKDIKANVEKYKGHFLACRLYGKDKMATGEYACVATLDAINFAVSKLGTKRRKSGEVVPDMYWLFDLEACMKQTHPSRWRVYK